MKMKTPYIRFFFFYPSGASLCFNMVFANSLGELGVFPNFIKAFKIAANTLSLASSGWRVMQLFLFSSAMNAFVLYIFNLNLDWYSYVKRRSC